MTDRDAEILVEYLDMEEFKKTTDSIETNLKLRPFERKAPFCRKKGLSFLTFLILLIYFYACFVIL